jgi:hypothetical protein
MEELILKIEKKLKLALIGTHGRARTILKQVIEKDLAEVKFIVQSEKEDWADGENL